jgi:DNA-binding PadR family transcriptional regulator
VERIWEAAVRRREEVGWADPAVLILTSLAGGPKHGYAMTADIVEQAGVTLGPGTLYGAISRLEERGLVRALPGEERRRPYEITAEGATVLRARLTAMGRLANVGLSRLGMVTA